MRFFAATARKTEKNVVFSAGKGEKIHFKPLRFWFNFFAQFPFLRCARRLKELQNEISDLICKNKKLGLVAASRAIWSQIKSCEEGS